MLHLICLLTIFDFMHKKTIDLTGQRFGRLLVAGMGERSANGRILWVCLCDCGNQKTITPAGLRHGGTRSCGCLRAEASSARTKGVLVDGALRRNPMYHRWVSMKQRCQNPSSPFFKNYGGRGIVLCDAWEKSFSAFVGDVGEPPSSAHTLERIDNDGPYSPQNVRWALRSEQLRNQRRTILIEVDGVALAAKDWAAKLGISYQKLTRTFREKGLDAAAEMVRNAIKNQEH